MSRSPRAAQPLAASLVSAASAASLAAARFARLRLLRPSLTRRHVAPLYYCWRVLWPLWIAVLIVAIGGSALAAYAQGGVAALERPQAWIVARLLLDHAGIALALAALAVLFSLIALIGYLGERRWRRRMLAPFLLRRARRLNPRDFLPAYVEGVYLPRREATTGDEADGIALEALHAVAAAANTPGEAGSGSLGICVFGAASQGKTRLAWEALRMALPEWRVMRWPLERYAPLDVSLLRGKRVVLWLDDLSAYAHPFEAIALNNLPEQCATYGVRLIVIATCRDGAHETAAYIYLASLLEQLTPVRLGNISPQEAEQLAQALVKQGAIAHSRQFDGTIGSLLLDTRELRDTRYPQLSAAGQSVLAAMKLLRSARVYRYPAARAQGVASALFGLAPGDWAGARDELLAAGFLRAEPFASVREAALVPVAAPYLERAVPDHINPNGEMSDDWPSVQETLERAHDAPGLLRLCAAFLGLGSGASVFLPVNVRASKVRAVMCARSALRFWGREQRLLGWGAAQLLLGDALARRADLSDGMLRVDLLRQARDAYEAAAQTFERLGADAAWATAHWRLALLSWQRAQDSVYAGEVSSACAYLVAAARQCDRALAQFTPRGDAVAHREVCRLYEQIEQAMQELGCAPDSQAGAAAPIQSRVFD